MYRLIVTRNGEPVLERHVPAGVSTLGRGRDNDVVLDGAKVSRSHAIVMVSDAGDCHLQDMGSRNGTFVGTERVGKLRLKPGDVFQVGPYACELGLTEGDVPAREREGEMLSATLASSASSGSDQSGGLPLFLGKSPAARRVLAQALRAAETELPVFISGESGSGKGVIASLIHRSGSRAAHPFVVLNCAAVPEALVESELFGHRKGAFTGAVADQVGKFRAADKGTILLDEIGDLSLAAQAKILRAIENQEVEPLGEPAPVKIDVRVIAATHQDLATAVAARSFRLDLFHRISTLTLEVPPLRERQDDVVVLANWFLAQLIDEIPRARGAAFSSEAIEVLAAHDWPGNVRELRNTVAQALVGREDDLIRPTDLRFARRPAPAAAAGPAAAADVRPREPALEPLAAGEARLIASALERCDWNLTRAAKALGIARSTLRARIQNLGLRRGGA